MLSNREEAEDCVQEVLMKLWAKKESLKTINNIKAFALRMARNLCLDRLKSKKPVVQGIDGELMVSDLNLHNDVELNDMLYKMHKIISQLPEQQRTIIHLRNIEELEMREIAEITGMKISHIRVVLSRARKNLREIYQKHYGHE